MMCSKPNSGTWTYFLRQSVDKTFRSTKIFRQRETSNDIVGLWSNAVEREIDKDQQTFLRSE